MKHDALVVLWKTGDKFNAEELVIPYTLNSKLKNWWKEVTLINWGSASRLISEDKELQERVKELKEAGVILQACKACADKLGVTETLESLGIEVIYMGEPLTKYIKEGKHVLTL
jgi:hypothetical protein